MTTKTRKFDTAKLVRDLIAARGEVLQALEGTTDSGTCNLDYCAVKLPRTKEVRAAIEQAGFRAGEAYGYLKGYTKLDAGTSGQAGRRQVAAEALCKALRAAGYEASVYYAID